MRSLVSPVLNIQKTPANRIHTGPIPTMRYTVLCIVLVNAVLAQRFDDESPPNYSPSTPYRERETLPRPVFGLGHRDREQPEEREDRKDYGRRPRGRDSAEQERRPEREFVRIPHRRDREEPERKHEVDALRERPEYVEQPEIRRENNREEPQREGRRNFRQRHGEEEDRYRPNGGEPRSQERDSQDSPDSGDRERAKIVGVNMHMVAGIYPEGKRNHRGPKEEENEERKREYEDREAPEEGKERQRGNMDREHRGRPNEREAEQTAPGRFSELSGPYPESRKNKSVEPLGNPYPREKPAGGPNEAPYHGEREDRRREYRDRTKERRGEEESRFREHGPTDSHESSHESDHAPRRRERPDRNPERDNETREEAPRSRKEEDNLSRKEEKERPVPKESRRPPTMAAGGFPPNFPPFKGFEEPDFGRIGPPDGFFPKHSRQPERPEGRERRRQHQEDDEPEERPRQRRPRPSRDSRENQSLEEDLHKRAGNGSFRDSDEGRRVDSGNGDRADRKPNLVDGEAGRTVGTEIPVITPAPRENPEESDNSKSPKEKEGNSQEEPEKILEDIMNAHLNETTVTDETATAVAFASKTLILPDEPLATNETTPIGNDDKIRVR